MDSDYLIKQIDEVLLKEKSVLSFSQKPRSSEHSFLLEIICKTIRENNTVNYLLLTQKNT